MPPAAVLLSPRNSCENEGMLHCMHAYLYIQYQKKPTPSRMHALLSVVCVVSGSSADAASDSTIKHGLQGVAKCVFGIKLS
jgi:hypothetical protein